MSGGDAPAAKMTRRQKIVQRTVVGGALTLGVALLLFLVEQFGDAAVLLLSLGISAVMIREAHSMGLLAWSRDGERPAGRTAAFACLLLATFMLPEESIGAIDLIRATILGVLVGWWAQRAIMGGDLQPGEERSYMRVVPVVALPMIFLRPIVDEFGSAGLAAFIGLCKVGDIAGYYFGNLLGRTHPFPNLSPGKTTEGCAASLLFGIGAGALLTSMGAFDEPRFGILSGLIFGALINIAAQAGDLYESSLKRRAGVKDSGTTFGPSGGMLDLVDSLIFAAPIAAFVHPVLFN